MLWCALHHHGPQGVHHDIPSKVCPSTSLPAHKVDFACTTIIHFANGSGTWLHFGCFASPLQQKHPTLSWCFRLKALGTMFSFPGLCQMSTLNKANVSCHLTYFHDNLGWVAKYFKVTLSVHTTTSLEPM